MSELVEEVARAIAPYFSASDRIMDEHKDAARAALSVIEGRVRAEERERAARIEDRAPTLCRAFRTTVAEGHGNYTMVFRFPTIEAMQDADREWHALRRSK